MPKTRRQVAKEVEEILSPGFTGGITRSKDWNDGFRYGSEAARDEWSRYNRAAVSATLDQLRAYARRDFDLGQVAGYEDALRGSSPWDRGAAEASTGPGGVVTVDTSVYRSNHGSEPRGRGDWVFVIGRRDYARSDDPAIYRPARARGVADLPYGKARDYAVAEARRRGASLVGVGS